MNSRIIFVQGPVRRIVQRSTQQCTRHQDSRSRNESILFLRDYRRFYVNDQGGSRNNENNKNHDDVDPAENLRLLLKQFNITMEMIT
jgi:hypothetical protein